MLESRLGFVLALCFVLAGCGGDVGGQDNNQNNNQNSSQPVCGNGTVEDGEACDEGFANSDTEPDTCRTNCRLPYCGDQVVDMGEACDDGDDGSNQPDACPATCQAPTCGDGHLWVGHEACDDGNTVDGDDCRGDCGQNMTLCGNGAPEAGEACDAGSQNSDVVPNACRENCQVAGCGDDVIDSAPPQSEVCDDGALNNDTAPNACRTDCRPAWCGDGVIDAGEVCDDGPQNSDTVPNACRTDCQPAGCGDSVIDVAEACDGSALNGLTCEAFGFEDPTGLACTASCEIDALGCAAQCGNGVQEPTEACDGSVPPSMTCDLAGYPGGGVLSCTDDCFIDTSTCCQDGDGDGYGANCTLGEDCDDTLNGAGITGACQSNGCPVGWIHVPMTTFAMGCDAGDSCWTGETDESPKHLVTLSGYCIQATEVRVEDYRACVNAGKCVAPHGASVWCNWSAAPADRELHPISCVTWGWSREYCQSWVGGNLPTEAQWELAARGTDERTYPWGASTPTCTECNWRFLPPGYGCDEVSTAEGPATWEVGFAPPGASFFGLLDMAGNVSEWVRDWYAADYYSSCGGLCSEPLNTDPTSGLRTIRGGSFWDPSVAALRTVERNGFAPASFTGPLGFRCIRVP